MREVRETRVKMVERRRGDGDYLQAAARGGQAVSIPLCALCSVSSGVHHELWAVVAFLFLCSEPL